MLTKYVSVADQGQGFYTVADYTANPQGSFALPPSEKPSLLPYPGARPGRVSHPCATWGLVLCLRTRLMPGPCLCPQSLTEHSKDSVLICSINDQISYSRYLFYIFVPFSANGTDPQLSLLATEEERRKIEVKHSAILKRHLA